MAAAVAPLSPSPAPPSFDPYTDFFEPLRGLGARPGQPGSLRAQLVEVLCAAAARGFDTGLEAPIEPGRFGEDDRVAAPVDILVWCSLEDRGSRLFSVEGAPATLQADLRTLDGRPWYTGDDCPLDVFGAGMRLVVAMGHDAAATWARLKGELEDRDGWVQAGLREVTDLGEASTALCRLRAPADLPTSVGRVFTVYDQTSI